MSDKYYKNQQEHSKCCDGTEFVVQTGETVRVKFDGDNELSISHFYESDTKGNLKKAYCDKCLATVNLGNMLIR